MDQKDCKNVGLRRKMALQGRLHARSNQHSCKFLPLHLIHVL